MPPGVLFFAAAGGHQLVNNRRQHVFRMLPADQVQQLERLVGEVEQVPSPGVEAVGGGGEDQVGQFGRRCAVVDSGPQCALGAVAVPNERPIAEPALQGRKIEGGRFQRSTLRVAEPGRRNPRRRDGRPGKGPDKRSRGQAVAPRSPARQATSARRPSRHDWQHRRARLPSRPGSSPRRPRSSPMMHLA